MIRHSLIGNPLIRRLGLLIAGIPILLSLQSCVFTVLDWATPNSGYQIETDIAYGKQPRQRLDIYTPTNPLPGAQTLVFFYGGAWDSGKKENYRFVAQAFAQQGYQVVIPDYRLYPEVSFPGFLEDAAKAVNWIGENIDRSIVLMGHSAGAHIAAMLVLDKQYLAATEFDRTQLAAWIGLSGPYDFLPFSSRRVSNIFKTASKPELTQPIYFANQKSIPALLIHGEADTRVLPKNSKNLASALKANNTAITEVYYPDTQHAATVAGISVRLRGQSTSFTDILAFLSSLNF